MIRRKPNPGFPVSEIAGRILHETLVADARAAVLSQDWNTETVQAPVFPAHAETDTGTLRAIVVAS